jgi:hypothetical protein
MIWFRDLLLGFFTRHLGTKLLALLLSVGLFGFVQSSLTGTQQVRQIKLRFSLADALRKKYVLLTEEIGFTGLTITGRRDKVDPLARLYLREPVNNLAINQKFLDVYGEAHGEGVRIRIDRDLFADDALFGRDVVVGGLPDSVAVVLDKIDERTASVEVAADMPKEITDPKHEYAGSRLALQFNVKSVTIEGPASAFTSDTAAVLASVKDIEKLLSSVQVQGELGEAKLSPVQIQWKGIATERLGLLRISAPELGGDPMWAREFQQRLVATCQLVKRKVSKSLEAVPIEIRYPLPRTFDLVEDYQVYGLIIDSDLRAGEIQRLEVRLPVSLSGNKEFLSNLVVVLDVGAATTDPATPESMFVPFYLDLKDRSRQDDVAGLALVEIVYQASPGSTRPTCEFREK